ncbi:MAG: pyruvate dehydrogenase (acetyl-transferring) E1 component subunit alpha [Waddliaceae bacterium]|nr:pyruvate dehydrogenase (acetyl-transferring) E1 component subunit alpha [Waddliaceae bacterium]
MGNTDTLETSGFFRSDEEAVLKQVGKEALLEDLRWMLLIRNLEIRAESAYQQGKVGGFFHAYIGQEAVQTSILRVMGREQWYTTSYRCHALALLLGASPNEIMAEFYGRETGNAKGRGGSMHLFTDRLLGGHGIVGGQIPVATGAALTLKLQGNTEGVSVCFIGDGAVAQGAFHESLNIASLWDLPCIYVIENNQWGMGTAVGRAISVERIAEAKASGYNMQAYTFDGMDYFNCHAGFSHVFQEVRKTQRPVLVEVITERFRGHSISDPGLYRSKEDLQKVVKRDPIFRLRDKLMEAGVIDEEQFKSMDKEQKQICVDAMKFAEESPWPDPITLEEDVLAP